LAGGAGWSPSLQAAVERTTAATRTALGAGAFEAALAEGAALSLEQAVKYVADPGYRTAQR
jgi:hypothetical protein